ncbi:MAG: DNA repair and recombination protein RadA [Thermoprotei archaeon]|nr:MAG: DNA repair and recombination protein RadA [Thermoprotei archaeon]
MADKEPTIDNLTSISSRTKKKLRDAGIFFLKDLMLFHPLRLVEMLGISEETANKIYEETLRILEEYDRIEYGFVKLSELEEREKEKVFLHTGSKNLDNILMGGWSSGEVTELAGEYATGKSQTCYTAIGTVFLPPEDGGLNTEENIGVAVLDTENTFSFQRMIPIFRRFDIDPAQAKERIWVARPKNTYHQLKAIEKLVKIVKDLNVRLIIVDSLTKLPRADFTGRGQLYDRQRIIISMIEKLRRLALMYNLVILVTNQVVAVPDVRFGRKYEPVGGHVLAHNVDTRLLMSRGSKNIRNVKIIDSSWLPPAETKIAITDAGITDPTE